MMPYLHIWRVTLPTFGLMLWFAAVAAALVMDQGFKRARIGAGRTHAEGTGPDAVGMVAVAMVVGIVGAKLWHVLDTPSEFQEMGWRAAVRHYGTAVARPLGEDRRSSDPGPGCPGGGNRLWGWPHRVLSFGRWLLRLADETAVGNELSEWHRADICSGAPNAPL
jgi:hypothetical protein